MRWSAFKEKRKYGYNLNKKGSPTKVVGIRKPKTELPSRSKKNYSLI